MPERWSWRLALAWAAVLLCVPMIVHPDDINPDSAMYLQCGALLLDGKVPYRDFIDINPPLIMYLSAIPVALARALSIGSILAFNLLVTALVGWSTWSLWRVLDRARRQLGPMCEWLTLGALGATLLSLYLKQAPPGGVTGYRPFGQREHLFVLLALPFLALRAVRNEGVEVRARAAIALGVCAGVGLSLKPQFLLLVAAPELYWLLARRRPARLLDPELVAAAATMAVYALHFLLVPAAMREAYFHRWAPLVWSGYAAYHALPGALWDRATLALAITVLVGGAAAARLHATPAGRLLAALSAFTLAGLVLYGAQQKGWVYHLIPAWTGASLIAALLLERLAGSRRAWRDGPRALVGGLLVVGSIRLAHERAPHFVDELNRRIADELRARTRPDDQVVMLSTAPWPIFPALVRAGRTPGSRYLWLFQIPMLYRGIQAPPYRTAPGSPEEARILRELSEDLERNRPALILVTRGQCFACPPGFDLYDYWRALGLRFDGYEPISGSPPFAWFARRAR